MQDTRVRQAVLRELSERGTGVPPVPCGSSVPAQARRLCHRRSFTLLEVMLAAALGAIIVLTCWSLLSSISRSDRRHRMRHRDTLELAITHNTFERTFQTLVVSETTPPQEPPKPGSFGARNNNVDPDDPRFQPSEAQLAEMDHPRMVLEDDTTMPAAMRGGDGKLYPPQRLAVALSAAPVFSPPRDELTDAMLVEQLALLDAQSVQERIAAKAAARAAKQAAEASLDATSDALNGGDAQAAGEPESDNPDDVIKTDPVEPGVRGVFELRPDDWAPPTAAELLGTADGTQPTLDDTDLIGGKRVYSADVPEGETGWTLWWRTIPDGPSLSLAYADSEEGLTEKERIERARSQLLASAMDAVPLLTGLRSLTYEVYDDGEFKEHFAAVWAQQLPAYVNVRYETLEGRKGEWMFEIGWIIGKQPGSTAKSPDAAGQQGEGEDGDGTDGENAGGGGGGGGNDSAGSGSGGGDNTHKPTKPTKRRNRGNRPGNNTPGTTPEGVPDTRGSHNDRGPGGTVQ